MDGYDLEDAIENYEQEQELRAERQTKVEAVYQEILELNIRCNNIMREDDIEVVRKMFRLTKEDHARIRANI